MGPIVKFEWKENLKKEKEILEYVDRTIQMYFKDIYSCNNIKITSCPIDFDSSGNLLPEMRQTIRLNLNNINNVVQEFAERYNTGCLTNYFTYKKYLQAERIQELIGELGMDKDKFWYLLLFAYDYSESICINGIDYHGSPIEQIISFINLIDEQYVSFDEENEGVKFKNDIELKIKVSGSRKTVIINDPTALRAMSTCCREIIENKDIRDCYIMNKRKILRRGYPLKDSPYIYFFAQIFLNVFNTLPQITNKRKKGAGHSIKEMDLVSKLIYFTKLSNNKSFDADYNDTLKSYLRQYKNLELTNRSSNIYTDFAV